jgi:hypothetical protein
VAQQPVLTGTRFGVEPRENTDGQPTVSGYQLFDHLQKLVVVHPVKTCPTFHETAVLIAALTKPAARTQLEPAESR